MAFIQAPDVRLAVPEDMPAIWDLALMCHEEGADKAYPLSEQKMKDRIALACHRAGSMIGTIGPVGGPLRGHILLQIDPIWFADDCYQLLEISAFVHPDHRRSTYAKQLIAFAKGMARDLGMHLTVGVLSDERTEAKCRLYRRQLPKVGEFFCYRPERDVVSQAAE